MPETWGEFQLADFIKVSRNADTSACWSGLRGFVAMGRAKGKLGDYRSRSASNLNAGLWRNDRALEMIGLRFDDAIWTTR
jgi:hypothetical protein